MLGIVSGILSDLRNLPSASGFHRQISSIWLLSFHTRSAKSKESNIYFADLALRSHLIRRLDLPPECGTGDHRLGCPKSQLDNLLWWP
jgi:hypothetical protein